MDWFKPTTSAIGNLAIVCMALSVIIYLVSLRKKTKNTRLIILLFTLIAVQETLIFTSDSNTTSPLYVFYIQNLLDALLHVLYFYFVWLGYRFLKSMYTIEGVVVLVIFAILFCSSFILIFKNRSINTQPSAILWMFQFSLYTTASLFSGILYLRKAKAFLKQNESPGFLSDLVHPSKKEIAVFRGFAIGMFMMTSMWLSLLLTLLQLVSWLAFTYMSYVIVLFVLILLSSTYITYAKEQTSFQAKLVGITLFIVLSILGLLPLILFGDTRFAVVSDVEERQIKTFVFIVPITTILISVLLPLLFRATILKNLNKVIVGVQQVNAGDLSANVNVEVNDEIGNLSRNFNRMTGSLQRYADKMNDLVDERTSALNQSLQELKSTQAQLIQSEKMASLGELTAGIAHEIQNPLNFVNNFSEVSGELLDEMNEELNIGDIEEAKAISNDIKQNLEKINHHGKRADAIVKGMLQHSRKNTGQKEPTDINALCDEYLRLSYHGLRAKDKSFNADYKTDFDETIGKINIVAQDMGRVLLNLFNNAFYAVSKTSNSLKGEQYKPLVSVQTKKLNSPSGAGGIEIIVSDNGSGIPQSIINKIFQPFFTTKPTGEGTGLGLSLSYDIIKAHGGEIKVETKQGEETTFIIQLPK